MVYINSPNHLIFLKIVVTNHGFNLKLKIIVASYDFNYFNIFNYGFANVAMMLIFNTEINAQIFQIIELKLISGNKIIIIIIINIDYIPFEEHAAMRDFPSVYRS